MQIGSIKVTRFNEGLTVFKPDYYLNHGKKTITDLIDKGIANNTLYELSDKLYQGGIFKRIFVENEKFGLKYVTASDMLKSRPLDVAKNISKKYTPWIDEMTLKENQILVSCAGTVGNAVLVDKSFAGCIGSQEIIRIETSKIEYGYVYAYLNTPLVYEYIQSMIYGAVVPRISPDEFGRLPVLIPRKSVREKIHNLIVESSLLREAGYKKLNEVHKWFDEKLKFETRKNIFSIKKSENVKHNFHKRLDSAYYLNIENPDVELFKSQYQSRRLGDLVSRKMFTAMRGKRNYVNSKGIRFLSTTNISERNPLLVEKYLSKKTTGLETLIVKNNWILISSSGQDILGSALIVDKTYADCAVNQHSIRVIIDDKVISPYYVYGYLSTPKVKEYIRSGIYGSAVLTIDENFLKNLQIPFFAISDVDKITELTKDAITSLEKACFIEKQAIEFVEKQINEWQK